MTTPRPRPHWKAQFEDGLLHIAGDATLYPNDYSTASLARQPDDPSEPGLLVYRVVFHRDKEPFCDPDLIGPVHYYEQHLPPFRTGIRVIAQEGIFEFPIPRR